MARKTFLFLSVIGLLFGAGVGMAQAQRAVAVSPGATKGVARIAQSCPTFSWGAVEAKLPASAGSQRPPPAP